MIRISKYDLLIVLLIWGVIGFSQDKPKKPVAVSKYPAVQNPNTSAESKLAAQYYRNQEYDKAARLYEKLYEKNPTYVNYTYYMYSLVQINEHNKAEKLVKKRMKKFSGKPRYMVDLGYVYISAEESAKGKKQFDNAINMLKPDKREIIDLANAFKSKRETDYAIKTYEHGRKLLNNAYPFHLELAAVYAQAQKYEKMFDEYLNLLEYDYNLVNTVQSKLQTALDDDPDNTKNDLFRRSLLKRIQRNPDDSYYSEMLLWFAVQQKDFETAFLQAKALDKRYREEGQRIFSLAQLSASNKDYDVAVEAYNYIINKGETNVLYLKSKVALLNVLLLKITDSYSYTPEELLELENDFKATLNEFGENPATLSLIRNMSHLQAFYLNNTQNAILMLNKAISIRNITTQQRAGCKLELADILLFSGEPWEATLLYSQVEKAFKHEPLGHEAKFKNAMLTYYIGEFEWAKAQLDVLKAATSKLIANDAMELSLLISDNMDVDSTYNVLSIYSKADLLVFQHKNIDAMQVLDSIITLYPGHPIVDEVLYKKAEILLSTGKFHEADTVLQQLITLFSYDILADNALFKLGDLHENYLNNQSKAMEYYQTLLTDYPGSLFSVEARKRYRRLRGDDVN
ncbi:MAG: tetratricopeptide repeat protein [Bacteroidales bacterium]|nr:tetratricopeptide repeat protein [Bacteroidales bacterium]